MEDEFLKRNTDCVYFLASPFTCKKGSQCEFRHSEGARLNPRDCWFWLQGNCLNPHCAFRHPPLDAWTEGSSEYLPELQLPPLSTTPKSTVPCYFYSSGHCIKGDQCPFLHGPNGIQPSDKLVKIAERNTTGPQLENKAPTITSAEPGSSNPPNRSSTPLQVLHKSCPGKPDMHDGGVSETEHCSSPQACAPEADDSTVRSSKSLLPEEDDYVSPQPDLLEGSEDHMNDTEREEWWESSPGLDVLVDDESEFLGYEEDVKYTLLHDRGIDQFHRHLLQHDYEDASRFEHYSEAELPRRHVTFDGYEAMESNYYMSDSMQRKAMQFRVRMPEQPVSYGKRRGRQYETERGYRNCVDLRDHLKKRRTDYGSFGYYSGDHSNLLRKSDMRNEQRGRHILEQNHERMSSQVARNKIGQYGRSDSRLRDKRRGRSGHAKPRHVKRQERERMKRKPNFTVRSEVARGQGQNDNWNAQETNGFTGPKSLSQIKEEKKIARESEEGLKSMEQKDYTNGYRDMSHHFQGPKSLNELLKDKLRPKPLEKASQLTSTISVDSIAHCRNSLQRDTREHKNGYINYQNSCRKEQTDGASDKRAAETSDFSDARDDDDFVQKLESMYP